MNILISPSLFIHYFTFLIYIHCGVQPLLHKRIENGCKAEADNDEFPFVGSFWKYLYPKDENLTLICTVTILDYQTILTAAHCFCDDDTFELKHENPENYYISFGSVNDYDKQNEQISQLINIHIHESYLNYSRKCSSNGGVIPDNEYYSIFDIAVAKLNNSLTYTQSVKPINISQQEFPIDTPITHAGFGSLKFNDSYHNPDHQLYFAESKLCRRIGKVMLACLACGFVRSRILHGDSGGPALVDINGVKVQAGVVKSHGKKGSYYTPTGLIYDWVMSHRIDYTVPAV